MNLEELKLQIEETVNSEWQNLTKKCPKFDVDQAYEWIKYWGYGGGPLSTECVIKQAIEISNGKTQTLVDSVKSDMYYEWGNCLHFYDVISAMITECSKKPAQTSRQYLLSH